MKLSRKFTPLAWITTTALSTILLTADVTLGQNAPDPAPGDRTTDQDRGQRGDRPQRGDDARGQRGDRPQRGDARRDRGGERRGPGGFGRGSGGPGNPMGMIARSMFRPLFMTRDLPVMVEMLELDEGQGEIVTIVLADYDAAFQLAAEETRDAVGALNETLRSNPETQERMEELRGRMETVRSEMREAREAMRGEGAEAMTEEARQEMRETFRSRMQEMHGSFREEMEERMEQPETQTSFAEQRALYQRFDSLRRSMNAETEEAILAILAEEQIALWDTVIRRIRRERLLPDGRISGESFNVEPFTRDAMSGADEEVRDAVATIVNVWTIDLDDALLRRDAFDATSRVKAMELMTARDSVALERLVLDRLKLQQVVRNINDTAVESIASAMSDEEGSAFKRDAVQDGYGRWLRNARSLRAIEAALQLEDLEESLRTAIVELQGDCTAAMAEQDERVLDAVRQYEEPRELRYIRGMEGDWSGRDREDTPLDEATQRRSDVDQEYIEALTDLLGEERASELPGMRSRERGNSGWQRGGGGEDREAMRQQFMKRFDANGDGEISDEEREAIREAFQNNRGGNRGGNSGPGRRGGDRPQGGGNEPV